MAQTLAQLIKGVNLASAPANSFTIDSSGRLLVGASSSRSGWFNSSSWGNPTLQVEGTSVFNSGISATNNSNDDNGSQIILGKSRATSVGGVTVVSSGDNLGRISFQGADGSELVAAATIECNVDGTPGANDMPGRLVFTTTADGASSPTERMRIDNLGYATGSIGSLGRGLYESYQFYSLNSGLAGSNVNTAQNILGVGVTLVANTIYEFEGIFVLTKTAGTTSHSFGLGFGGTATLNNIQIQSIVSSSANALPTNGSGFLGASTSAATFNCITGIAVATVSIFVRLKGIVSTSGAGTFIPQYTLSAAPGGAYTTNAGSHFKIAPLAASGANVSIGTWA